MENLKTSQESKFDNHVRVNMPQINVDFKDKEDIVEYKEENMIDTEQTPIKENSDIREIVEILEKNQDDVEETLDS